MLSVRFLFILFYASCIANAEMLIHEAAVKSAISLENMLVARRIVGSYSMVFTVDLDDMYMMLKKVESGCEKVVRKDNMCQVPYQRAQEALKVAIQLANSIYDPSKESLSTNYTHGNIIGSNKKTFVSNVRNMIANKAMNTNYVQTKVQFDMSFRNAVENYLNINLRESKIKYQYCYESLECENLSVEIGKKFQSIKSALASKKFGLLEKPEVLQKLIQSAKNDLHSRGHILCFSSKVYLTSNAELQMIHIDNRSRNEISFLMSLPFAEENEDIYVINQIHSLPILLPDRTQGRSAHEISLVAILTPPKKFIATESQTFTYLESIDKSCQFEPSTNKAACVLDSVRYRNEFTSDCIFNIIKNISMDLKNICRNELKISNVKIPTLFPVNDREYIFFAGTLENSTVVQNTCATPSGISKNEFNLTGAGTLIINKNCDMEINQQILKPKVLLSGKRQLVIMSNETYHQLDQLVFAVPGQSINLSDDHFRSSIEGSVEKLIESGVKVNELFLQIQEIVPEPNVEEKPIIWDHIIVASYSVGITLLVLAIWSISLVHFKKWHMHKKQIAAIRE